MNDKRGTEKNDPGALTEAQQTALNAFKVKTHLENERYLRDHPEIECLVQSFVSEVCKERPGDLREYAAEYFTNPDLALSIQAMVQQKQTEVKGSQKN